jgi:dTDP-4-amino-4,6-dideoxygalactose transaminase
VHQQPFFTEGAFKAITRNKIADTYTYDPQALPKTEKFNQELIKLPTFPQADRALLIEYVQAFDKVLSHWKQIETQVAQ